MYYTQLVKNKKEDNNMRKFVNELLDFYAVFFERNLYRA